MERKGSSPLSQTEPDIKWRLLCLLGAILLILILGGEKLWQTLVETDLASKIALLLEATRFKRHEVNTTDY